MVLVSHNGRFCPEISPPLPPPDQMRVVCTLPQLFIIFRFLFWPHYGNNQFPKCLLLFSSRNVDTKTFQPITMQMAAATINSTFGRIGLDVDLGLKNCQPWDNIVTSRPAFIVTSKTHPHLKTSICLSI